MAQVAVLHNTLDFQGGADAVCLGTCEALLADHEVTLFTLSETDPAVLADRFDADLEGLAVRTPPANGPIARTLARLGPTIGPQLAFRSVLVWRYFRGHAEAFDLTVSTANEFSLPGPSVQYVHYPQFHLRDRADADSGRLNPVWSRVSGPDRWNLRRATLLANSAWTADVVENIYGVRPEVLHPPVDPVEGGLDWDDRERGIVVVGRIAPDKRVLDAISIVDSLRDRGHDIHLHVVGSAPRSYRRYAQQVASAAGQRSYVALERDVPREQLQALLRTHRYGLNLKPDEHFGMSVAEYVSAGMIAFAPDSGGQRDVLDGRSDRLFDSPESAVDLIESAIRTDDRPSLPRDRFTRDRFKAAINEYVNRVIAR
ncbi:glycosyltransferase [Halorhabdus amylolytica]|uniref:glycosyltransferase n=1 Tax=Halorhabdus amylolytica TaxID=2559573 RepID=UPI0010A9E501|nr:glycosyltransferase [Halorhabdus amylolytica]